MNNIYGGSAPIKAVKTICPPSPPLLNVKQSTHKEGIYVCDSDLLHTSYDTLMTGHEPNRWEYVRWELEEQHYHPTPHPHADHALFSW